MEWTIFVPFDMPLLTSSSDVIYDVSNDWTNPFVKGLNLYSKAMKEAV